MYKFSPPKKGWEGRKKTPEKEEAREKNAGKRRSAGTSPGRG
jgi:hypothetical protein